MSFQIDWDSRLDGMYSRPAAHAVSREYGITGTRASLCRNCRGFSMFRRFDDVRFPQAFEEEALSYW